ncbi:MAG: hypothetical protein GX312_00400 [Candidatus Phytoplasma sp.]|nr:hypothetical protein [Phytoplasma sp.]
MKKMLMIIIVSVFLMLSGCSEKLDGYHDKQLSYLKKYGATIYVYKEAVENYPSFKVFDELSEIEFEKNFVLVAFDCSKGSENINKKLLNDLYKKFETDSRLMVSFVLAENYEFLLETAFSSNGRVPSKDTEVSFSYYNFYQGFSGVSTMSYSLKTPPTVLLAGSIIGPFHSSIINYMKEF